MKYLCRIYVEVKDDRSFIRSRKGTIACGRDFVSVIQYNDNKR